MPKIQKIHDSIVTLEGKYDYEQDQIFKLSDSASGIVLSATENSANLLVLGDPTTIKIKEDVAVSKKNIDNIDVYEGFFGSIISPFGKIIHPTGKKNGEKIGTGKLDGKNTNLLDRVKLSEPLKTGIFTIDTMIPIGKGQRELIIGDRTTGKTSIILNAIINQRNENVKTIYVSVGQKRSSIIAFLNKLEEFNAFKDVIIIFANPDSASEQFLAPKIGMAMAEALAYQGEDVLIAIDDLTKHANVYREISLSIGKTPGREAYPSDIFYQHSKLLERAGRFNEKYKNGSITCLPIVETVRGDIASLIPSNVISITDGQIFTSVDAFNNGEYPAINIGLSVSRTGSAVQSKVVKIASKGLKATYANLFDIKKFADMSIDLSAELIDKIEDWKAVNNVLLQFGYEGYSEEEMLILSYLFNMKTLNKIIDRKNFSIAFRNYCARSVAAQKIITNIKNGKYLKEKEEFFKALTSVFVPFVKIASGIKNDIITETEFKRYKGGL